MELMEAIGTRRSMRICPICPRSILKHCMKMKALPIMASFPLDWKRKVCR